MLHQRRYVAMHDIISNCLASERIRSQDSRDLKFNAIAHATMTMAPQSTNKWTVEGHKGFDSLQFHEGASLPPLGDHDVLVRFHAASLNYRDLIIAKVRTSQEICLGCH